MRSSPRHVMVFGLHWPPETFVLDRLQGLVACGMRITVATSIRLSAQPPPAGITLVSARPAAEAWGRGLLQGLTSLVRLAATRPSAALRVLRSVREPSASGRLIRRAEALERLCTYATLAARRPDVVHIEWSPVAIEYVSLLWALGCPAVVSCHSEPVLDELDRPRMPSGPAIGAVYARAAAVHCVAEAIRGEAVRRGADGDRARVIHGGVDLELFHPRAGGRRDRETFEIVMVSQLRWLKGHEFALLAVARLVAERIPARLEIIGGDPTPEMGEPTQRARIAFVADRLGISRQVRFASGLARDELARRVREADVLLQTSLSEAFPTVVLEAMASGVPVVATRVGGTGESIRDGIEGLLIPPYDPAAAATALRRLWADPGLRRRMGAAGRTRAEVHFGLERHVAEWVRLLEDVGSR